MYLRPSITGILGAVICLIGIFIPWWTSSATLNGVQSTINMFPYAIEVHGTGLSFPSASVWWVGWVTLALLLTGSTFAIIGSFTFSRRQLLLSVGALLTLSAAIFFPFALPMYLKNEIPNQIAAYTGLPLMQFHIESPLGNFSSPGTWSSGSMQANGLNVDWAIQPSFGLVIALIGTCLLVGAALRGITVNDVIKRWEKSEEAQTNQGN